MKTNTIQPLQELFSGFTMFVETNYIPLSGNLDVKRIAKKIKERVLKDFKFINSKIFKQIIFFSTDYPRFLDRIETANYYLNILIILVYLERVGKHS